jgi:hypothetical protein
MEHRSGHRLDVHLPVRIRGLSGDVVAAGRIRNLSLTGALIETAFDASVHGGVEVAVNNEWVLAWLTRRSPGAIAVEWMMVAPQAVVRQIEVAELPCSPGAPARLPATA